MSVHVDYDLTTGTPRLEKKAHVPSVNSPNDKPGLTAVAPRKDPGGHVHVLNSHVRKDAPCPDTQNVTVVAAVQPETKEHSMHDHLESATSCLTLPNPNPDCRFLAHDEGGGGEKNGNAKQVLYMGAERCMTKKGEYMTINTPDSIDVKTWSAE
eukprot:3787012-Pleurochrysis_carterae.AAC.1